MAMVRAWTLFSMLALVACSGSDAADGGDGNSATGGASSGGSAGTGAGNGGAANGGASNGGTSNGGTSNGGTSSGGTSSGGTSNGGAAGTSGSSGAPPAICDEAPLVDASNPGRVVGTGTPASCTTEALQAAATAGGIITFDCGEEPVVITVSQTIVMTEETVLDGGGLVTLSGGGSERILYLDSGYDQTTPRLTVQRLAFRDGSSSATGEDTADGGAAIYHAPGTGQDLAGGAIYGFGGGETRISGSTFVRNSASDGGAVGSLNGDLIVVNSTFTDNEATGTDGNPGNGGCGGAIYMDGGDETTTFCGVSIVDNAAGAIGGGVFRVSNSDDGTFVMDRSSVDGNRVTPSGDGNAGGMYLQGLALTITASTISWNEAFYCGGLWINEREANLTNVTIAENTAFGSNGGGLWLGNEPSGTVLNSTIANNHSTADGMIAGAIFGEGLSLKNTIVSGNTARYTPGCNAEHESGGGNLQFPEGALCTDDPTIADPMLGVLGDNGGPTRTLLPAATSPALGLGTDCPPTDQRGEARGEPCTAGAVEVR
jgi:hypothetical protein